MRQEILGIKDKYKVKVLLGIEANLISSKGDIDINDEDFTLINSLPEMSCDNINREFCYIKVRNIYIIIVT